MNDKQLARLIEYLLETRRELVRQQMLAPNPEVAASYYCYASAYSNVLGTLEGILKRRITDEY